MTFTEIIHNLIENTLEVSLPAYVPELILCATIVLMLLVRVFKVGQKVDVFWIALVGVALALISTSPQFFLDSSVANVSQLDASKAPGLVPKQAVEAIQDGQLFTGLLKFDRLTVYFRAFLLFFTFLFVVLTRLTRIPDKQEGPDFYTLVLGSIVGMCVMVASNHLLMVFLGVEMASVPAYVLAGTLKGRRKASEAALKFAVYGAGAAGVMLYGISLLAGVLGTAHLPTMAERLGSVLLADQSDRYMVLILGGLMLMVGLAFKLSAVPFHFWAPDVFEGATSEINAFLSVASKAAAIGLLIRVAVGLGGESLLEEQTKLAQAPPPAAAVTITPVSFADQPEHGEAEKPAESSAAPTVSESDRAALIAGLAPARTYIVWLIGFIAAITATWGNLAAYGQTNIKRLLAYSTIAHAGYMMMPVAAVVSMMGDPAHRLDAQAAIASVLAYVAAYLFMNLGAFAIVAFLRNTYRTEEIADYAGLIRRSPGMAICFSIILLSLLGIPPMAGFVAKIIIFGALADAGLWYLLIIGGLNTLFSLFYYIRVVKVMTVEPEPEERLPIRFPLLFSIEGWYVMALTFPLIALTLQWDWLMQLTQTATRGLF